MANLQFFKDLSKASNDPEYPKASSHARENHYEYATNLIARFRSASSDVADAVRLEGNYRGVSLAAKNNDLVATVGDIMRVEREINELKRGVDEGKLVTIVDGQHRHDLGQAFADLYFEMKNYYLAKEAGRIGRTTPRNPSTPTREDVLAYLNA